MRSWASAIVQWRTIRSRRAPAGLALSTATDRAAAVRGEHPAFADKTVLAVTVANIILRTLRKPVPA